MAVRLKKRRFSVNLSSVVVRAAETIKSVRQTEQARKEAEYQKAIASGLSYNAQLEFRQKQLDEERVSPSADLIYVLRLEESVNTIKKLSRFEKIRNKYADSLNSYVTGKSSIAAYISVLEQSTADETDPEMVGQLKDLLGKARQEQYSNEINAVKNRVKLAETDQSIPMIEKSIQEVKDRKAVASINKNDDEVAMWDQSLSALTSTKSKLLIENSTNEITFKINKNNPKASEKLNYLSEEVGKAESSSPVTYNGVTYNSMKMYWEDQRNQYLSSSFFTEVEKELAAETKNIAQQNEFGQIPVSRIQAVNDFYSNLAMKPEFAPFAEQLGQKRIDTVANMATDLASAIYDEWNAVRRDENISASDLAAAGAKAENSIVNLESRFGVKIARQALPKEISANKSVIESVTTGLENMPAKSASSPKNAAEILRAQDVWKNADKLAGTGKYTGQTADQVREGAHNYATDIRSGKVDLDKQAPTPDAPKQGATAQELADYAAAHNTIDLQNQTWWSQAPVDIKKNAWSILQKSAMPEEAPTPAKPVKSMLASTTKKQQLAPIIPTEQNAENDTKPLKVADTGTNGQQPVSELAPQAPLSRADFAAGAEGLKQYQMELNKKKKTL